MNPNIEARLKELEEKLEALEARQINHQDIRPKGVKQRNIDGLIIFKGLAADRPDGDTEVQAYFATDTGVLSIWDGSAWLSETLT
jgi:hypothetical protein